MRSVGAAAKDSLVQKPSRTTRQASHSRTQCGLVPRAERAMPSQLMHSSALGAASAEGKSGAGGATCTSTGILGAERATGGVTVVLTSKGVTGGVQGGVMGGAAPAVVVAVEGAAEAAGEGSTVGYQLVVTAGVTATNSCALLPAEGAAVLVRGG